MDENCTPTQDAYGGEAIRLLEQCSLPVTGMATLDVALLGAALLSIGCLVWYCLPGRNEQNLEEPTDE